MHSTLIYCGKFITRPSALLHADAPAISCFAEVSHLLVLVFLASPGNPKTPYGESQLETNVLSTETGPMELGSRLTGEFMFWRVGGDLYSLRSDGVGFELGDGSVGTDSCYVLMVVRNEQV